MAIQVTINKMRKHAHQFTEVAFTLNGKRHKIKVELCGGSLSGLLKTDFTVGLDDVEIYHKSLYTLFLQKMKHSFIVEDKSCLIKYTWLSGIWFGHIYIDGEVVV